MPPPTRANRACVEAPMPNVSIVVVIVTSFCGPVASMKWSSMMYHREMSRRPRPTTVSPITAPERNASFSPEFRERMAALAVLAEAYVAVFMPTNPARPEKKPPVRKANGTHGFCTLNPYASTAKNAASITNTIVTTLYCCFR